MLSREKKKKQEYRIININSTTVLNKRGFSVLASGHGDHRKPRERAYAITLMKLSCVSSVYIVGRYISYIGADLNGCSTYVSIRPKYHAGETRRLAVVFIDPRHLLVVMFYDAPADGSWLRRSGEEVAPGLRRDVARC